MPMAKFIVSLVSILLIGCTTTGGTKASTSQSANYERGAKIQRDAQQASTPTSNQPNANKQNFSAFKGSSRELSKSRENRVRRNATTAAKSPKKPETTPQLLSRAFQEARKRAKKEESQWTRKEIEADYPGSMNGYRGPLSKVSYGRGFLIGHFHFPPKTNISEIVSEGYRHLTGEAKDLDKAAHYLLAAVFYDKRYHSGALKKDEEFQSNLHQALIGLAEEFEQGEAQEQNLYAAYIMYREAVGQTYSQLSLLKIAEYHRENKGIPWWYTTGASNFEIELAFLKAASCNHETRHKATIPDSPELCRQAELELLALNTSTQGRSFDEAVHDYVLADCSRIGLFLNGGGPEVVTAITASSFVRKGSRCAVTTLGTTITVGVGRIDSLRCNEPNSTTKRCRFRMSFTCDVNSVFGNPKDNRIVGNIYCVPIRSVNARVEGTFSVDAGDHHTAINLSIGR